MPKFLSSIWTSIIEYETPRLVRIHNRKLGLVRRLIQFSIVCYVLVYALWLQQGYQEFTRVESSVTVKIKGVTKSELGDGTDLDPCKYTSHWEELLQSVSNFIFRLIISKHYGYRSNDFYLVVTKTIIMVITLLPRRKFAWFTRRGN